MLKNFLYLDEAALSDYLSALEGGVRSTIDDRRLNSSGREGRASLGGVIGGSGQSGSETETKVSFTDSPPAQFERLIALAAADPERVGWVEVLDPDGELPGLLKGALIDIECDIEVPSIVRALAQSSELISTLRTLSSLRGIMPTNVDTPNIDEKQLSAVEAMGGLVGEKLLIVGIPDSDSWKVTGQLLPDFQRSDDLEGDVRVVGKISRIIKPGESHPLLALPGTNIISREKRREMARKGASNASDTNSVRGPALILDILAIYR